MRILVVEDGTAQVSILVRMLGKAGYTRIDEASSREAALREIEKSSVDVAFVDLWLRPEDPHDQDGGIPEGIAVISHIREAWPSAAIIAYSRKIKSESPEAFRYRARCHLAGADMVLSRADVLSAPPEQLSELIVEALTARDGIGRRGRRLTVASDLGTQAAVERVTDRVVRQVLAQLVDDSQEDEVEAVSGGHSGSVVFRVKSLPMSDGEEPKRYMLKLSDCEFALERELAAAPPIGTTLERRSITPGKALQGSIGGWWAFTVSEITGSIPLSRYLSDGPVSAEVSSLLSNVVQDVLASPAKTAGRASPSSVELSLSYAPSMGLAWEASRTLAELGTLSAVVSSHHRRRAIELAGFVERLATREIRLLVDGQRFARLHGDFHCENLFVGQRGSALLIDFERSRVYPRLFDYACLDVDLMINQLDSQGGADRQWDRVAGWANWSARGFPFTSNRVSETEWRRDRLSHFRYMVLESLRADLEGVTGEEYASALVFHLLRYLRFSSITWPKRALAARLAKRLVDKFELTGS